MRLFIKNKLFYILNDSINVDRLQSSLNRDGILHTPVFAYTAQELKSSTGTEELQ